MISVIIPVYNTVNYIDACLESITNQSYKDLDIICIDDNSSDGSQTVLRKWEKKDRRIRVIYKKENKGVSDSRNIGLDILKGDFVSFVDSDDYLEKTTYERVLSVVDDETDVVLFGYSKTYSNNEEGCRFTGMTKVLTKEDVFEHCFPRYNKPAMDAYIWDKLYKTSIINNKTKCIRFDNSLNYCEDAVWLTQVVLNSNGFVRLDTPFYHYRVFREGNTFSIHHNSRSTQYVKSAITAYTTVFELMKENRIPCARNAYRRMLSHRERGMIIGDKLNDEDIFMFSKQNYLCYLLNWWWMDKSFFATAWIAKKIVVYCFMLINHLSSNV